MKTQTNTTTEVNPNDYHTILKLDRADIFNTNSWLSKSAVSELYQSSLYKWRYYPRNFSPTPAMAWGSMVDCLLTCPAEQFEREFVISPHSSFRTNAAKDWKLEQEELGYTIITDDQRTQAYRAADVVLSKHKHAASLVGKSKSQVLLMNRILHPASDKKVGLKGLVDFAPEGEPFLVDLKTTRDFSEGGFAKTISKFSYNMQAAHYLGLWNMQNPDDQRHRFQIIWQDSASPYEVAVTEIPEVDIAAGADMFNHLLGKIIRAADRDYWPMRFEKPILVGRASFGAYADEEEMDGGTIIS